MIQGFLESFTGPRKKTFFPVKEDEFERLLHRIIEDITSQEVATLFRKIDITNSGSVTVRELIISLSVVSPSLLLEYFRAKLIS